MYFFRKFSLKRWCFTFAGIVSKARETLELAMKHVEANPRWKAKVVYGDTDRLLTTSLLVYKKHCIYPNYSSSNSFTGTSSSHFDHFQNLTNLSKDEVICTWKYLLKWCGGVSGRKSFRRLSRLPSICFYSSMIHQCYLLFDVCFVLYSYCYLLIMICDLLFVIYCLLFIVYCLLFIVCCCLIIWTGLLFAVCLCCCVVGHGWRRSG